MSPPVPHSIPSELPTRPPVTAGTDKPEGVAAETVAAVPAVRDSEPTPPNHYRMKHDLPSGYAEAVRQARLRRWQEQR